MLYRFVNSGSDSSSQVSSKEDYSEKYIEHDTFESIAQITAKNAELILEIEKYKYLYEERKHAEYAKLNPIDTPTKKPIKQFDSATVSSVMKMQRDLHDTLAQSQKTHHALVGICNEYETLLDGIIDLDRSDIRKKGGKN